MLYKFRYCAGDVRINETHWWVTGGSGSSTTTEMYNALTDEWSLFVDIPNGSRGHCVMQINKTLYFVMGAENTAQAHFFDLTSKTWTRQSDASRVRPLPACGMLRKSDGDTDLFLMGGDHDSPTNSVEIFSVKTKTWRPGQPLPKSLALLRGVQFEDTFIIVGGYRFGNTYSDRIYKYQANLTTDPWVELEQRLEQPKGVYTAFLVPKSALLCH